MSKRKPPVDLPRAVQDGRAYQVLLARKIPLSVIAVMAGRSEADVERLIQQAKDY